MGEFSVGDIRRLEAAEGWLELGNPAEAKAELEQVATEFREHPWVLHLLWRIHADARHWEEALAVATTLAGLEPKDPRAWVNRSYALHELKRTPEARECLLPVLDRFPKNAVMRYNLACYETQLGNLPQAIVWLRQAFALPGGERLKAAAGEDPDLAPLWGKLGEI